MIEIVINDKIKLSFPENWEEIIKENKYDQVVTCLYKEHENEDSKRIELFSILSGFDGYQYGKILKAATTIDRTDKAENIGFALSMQLKETIFPILDFVFTGPFICPYPKLSFENCNLISPGDKLYDQTGHEMMLTHFSMTHYAMDKNERDINMIIAVNYHYEIDKKRQKFNEDLLDDIYQLVLQLPFEKKLGIYHWICKCDEWWYNKYMHLFEGDELSVAPSFQEQADTWRKLLLRLAENKLGVDYDRIISRTRQDLFFLLDENDKELQKKEIENFDK